MFFILLHAFFHGDVLFGMWVKNLIMTDNASGVEFIPKITYPFVLSISRLNPIQSNNKNL